MISEIGVAAAPTNPPIGVNKGKRTFNLASRIQQVCADSGASAAVPEQLSVLQKGARVRYCDGQLATVSAIHHDDLVPYYTIRFDHGGAERQTVRSKLSLL